MDIDEMKTGSAFHTFGESLRYARTSFAERILNLPSGLPHVELSSRALIACLAKHGYPISSSAFSSLEAGNSLPRDPERFLRSLYLCLGIGPDDSLGRVLALHLAYDLIQRELGEFADLLDLIIPDEFRHRNGTPKRQPKSNDQPRNDEQG